MADIGAALVTGGATIVGVVAGAGLTYWSTALNRRHQEAREDKTRWYEARLKACTELALATSDGGRVLGGEGKGLELAERVTERFESSLATLMLLGSREVVLAGHKVLVMYRSMFSKEETYDGARFSAVVAEFHMAARADLGVSAGQSTRISVRGQRQDHPSPLP